MQAGLCRSLDEAFDRYLKVNRPAWVPKRKMSVAGRDYRLIHQAGGVAVMAHPGLNRTDQIIPELVSSGMDGIECFHSKHSTATSNHYLQVADKYNLLVTGGSDCHGMNKGKPLIGSIKVPYQHVEKLKARAAEHRAKLAAVLHRNYKLRMGLFEKFTSRSAKDAGEAHARDQAASSPARLLLAGTIEELEAARLRRIWGCR